MLYDFYGQLLTDKQRKYVKLYYREDFSLAEIAEVNNVSRQAIYDNIKRTEQLIEMYEEKLQLFAKFSKRQELIAELKTLAESEAMLRLITKLDNMN